VWDTMNNKQQDQSAISNNEHRVLIAKSVIGNYDDDFLSHSNAKITIKNFQDADRLKDYDIIILSYSEFEVCDGNDRKFKDPYKDIFEKQALEALDQGTMFCFVHHRENVPGLLHSYNNSGYFDEIKANSCFKRQAGFRWIYERNIRICLESNIILDADVKRSEFNTFLNKWGATYNIFTTFKDGKVDDIICLKNNYPIGFSIKKSRGNIVYLPFQANRQNPQDLKDGVLCLVDSLLTYKAKHNRELPDWAKEPFFKNETILAAEKRRILESLQAIDNKISPYEEAKLLLTANEHDLEVAVPMFISNKLGILTKQEEIYAEDFWILNNQKEENVICEVKSVTKGFKKSAIYDVYNHREKRKMPDTFPAIVFVNFNLQAGSWVKKGDPIQNSDYKIAVENHVLIVRIEDLVQLWNSLIENKLSVETIMKYFTTESGWLECNDGNLVVHK
jgi:hypothetical protein